MLKKISHRIIFSYTALIILLAGSLIFIFNGITRDAHMKIIRREMDEKLRFIELIIIRDRSLLSDPARLSRETAEISEIIQLRVTIIDLAGRVISDSEVTDVSAMDNHLYRTEILSAVNRGHGDSIRQSSTLQSGLLYTAKKTNGLIVRLSKPLNEINANLSILRTQVMFFSSAVIMSAFLIAVYLSRKITRPINETLDFAKNFAEGNFSRRILNYSEDEIGTVQRALNRMADTIAEKIDSLIFEQNKLKITLESISDGIAVVGNDTKILIANKAFGSFSGSESGVQGRSYFEAIRSRTINEKIGTALSGGLSFNFDEKMINGRHCSVYINPIKAEKNLQGILVLLYDITEKRKIEQIKTDLVANMSHELKTPVAIMKGYLETIMDSLNDKEACALYLNKAVENADRQNAIINDILKLNMLETSVEFPMENIDIQKILDNCVKILSPKAARKNISISTDLSDSGIQVKGSPFLAEEIFFNLMDNAISYSNQGGAVNIYSVEVKGRITVTISDNGIGIPSESISRIFERFYRVDKGRSRTTGGTGLGLSIVKHACELLGWTVSVESAAGQTEFRITI